MEAACQSSAGDGDGNGSLDFGTLDFGSYGSLDSAISAASSEGSGSINVTCVAGQSYAILLDGGSSGSTANRQMVAQSGSDARIAYNLFTDPGHAQVWDDSTGVAATGTGSEQVHTVYGLVQAQSTPAAGTYADTVNVTISW
ncbi:spore coat U domain-containing protein [Stenotrophomonas sp. MMGLT7]|nr:spore coat U domain-containing protein [Stenotrophomonas sp. MMGLT7]